MHKAVFRCILVCSLFTIALIQAPLSSGQNNLDFTVEVDKKEAVVGEFINLTVKIRNNSTQERTNIPINLYVDSKQIEYKNVDIAPWSDFVWNKSLTFDTAGEHNITVRVNDFEKNVKVKLRWDELVISHFFCGGAKVVGYINKLMVKLTNNGTFTASNVTVVVKDGGTPIRYFPFPPIKPSTSVEMVYLWSFKKSGKHYLTAEIEGYPNTTKTFVIDIEEKKEIPPILYIVLICFSLPLSLFIIMKIAFYIAERRQKKENLRDSKLLSSN